MDLELSAEQREYVQILRRGGDTLLSLINDILDLSKVEGGHLDLERSEFDLPELVEFATTVMTLFSGDVIACGTNHEGLGALQDGETVEIEIQGIGRMSLKVADPLLRTLGIQAAEERYLASMGIYVFSRQVLVDVLNNSKVDFGKDIIPNSIQEKRVFAYLHQGYWEDIGSIRSFYDANLDLTKPDPQFDFFDPTAPYGYEFLFRVLIVVDIVEQA